MHNEDKLRTATHPLLKLPRSVSAAIQAHTRIQCIINPAESATSKAMSYQILGIGSTCPEFTLTPVHLIYNLCMASDISLTNSRMLAAGGCVSGFPLFPGPLQFPCIYLYARPVFIASSKCMLVQHIPVIHSLHQRTVICILVKTSIPGLEPT